MGLREQLVSDPAAVSQRVASELPARGRFSGGITIEHVALIPPRSRAGKVVALRLDWQAESVQSTIPKVAVALVDGGGTVRAEFSYWLGLGLVRPELIPPGAFIQESLILRLPDDLEPGEYGVELAIYRPLRGDSTLRDLGLGFARQERRPLVAGGAPHGVTPASIRAATLRVGASGGQTEGR
jgi:hypothetical protein